MSLDIWLDTPDTHETIENFNITHNLAIMARHCGLYNPLWRLEESGIKTAKELSGHLAKHLPYLIQNPEDLKQYNPANGWGSYDSFVKWVINLYICCLNNPNALVYSDK